MTKYQPFLYLLLDLMVNEPRKTMPTMYPRRTGPKEEYQEQQRKRVIESPSLAVQYPRLKSLTVTLEYHDEYTSKKRSQLKYMVNLSHAKSVFRFKCPNHECMRGDFELTKEVAEAVTKH